MSASKSSLTALTLGAIGVVYGDIGTSVLYAVKEIFGSGHVPFTPDNIYGILSLIFWTLSVISVMTLIPSVGGLGVRESAALTMLGLYGIAPERAVSAALLCFVVQLIWAAAGACILWRAERAIHLRP